MTQSTKKSTSDTIQNKFKSNFLRAIEHPRLPDYEFGLDRGFKSKPSLDETVDDHGRSLEALKAAQQIADETTRELKASTASSKKDLQQLKDELNRDRYRTVEVLALFVAFFTFVSVEFQLFSNLTKLWQVLSLTLVLLGSLILFVVLLSRIVNDNRTTKYKNWKHSFRSGVMNSKLLILSVLIIVVGIIIMIFNASKDYETEDFQNNKSAICKILISDIVSGNEDVATRATKSYSELDCNSR